MTAAHSSPPALAEAYEAGAETGETSAAPTDEDAAPPADDQATELIAAVVAAVYPLAVYPVAFAAAFAAG